MLTKFFIVILILLPLLSYQARAETYYVDRNHPQTSNTNPGSLNLPWLTVQHAAEIMIAGDSVFIRNGVYNEQVRTMRDGNGTGNEIVFFAHPAETPIIDGTGVTTGNTGIIVSHSYIKLFGLEIRNWNETGIWIENAGFIEISDCIVHNVSYGIGVADGTHDFVFNRVEIHHFDLYGFDASPSGGSDCYNGTFNDCIAYTGRDPNQNVDGFALGHGSQHDFTFNRCETYDVFDGFDVGENVGGNNTNIVFNRCLARDCWNDGFKLTGHAKLVNCLSYNSSNANAALYWDVNPTHSTLMNCTFFNTQSYNVWIENVADTLQMYNCILAGGDNIGLGFEQMGVSNYQGDYNIFHNDNTDRAISVAYTDEFSLQQIQNGAWTSYSGQDAHSQVVFLDTTLFADPTNLDLHVLSSSLAVDNGTSNGAPSDDFEGNPRPSGPGYDIGAYEYQQSTGLLPGRRRNSVLETARLFQNYPNPFNPNTILEFNLPNSRGVRLEIFNITGKEVVTLVSDKLAAGQYSYEWNASNLASGLYLYRLRAGNYIETRKMVLMR